MTSSFLQVDDLAKSFGANAVVKGVSFGFARGEFISLLGPSGCGKTTILRMIAGFEAPSAGRILVDGRDITPLGVRERDLGMVFQAYALFPNMTVADNVAFGLKMKRWAPERRRARVADMLRLVGLAGFEKRYPYEMSGGQQQRVALARALAPEPRLLLLDEPLSALDAKIRHALRDEIRAIQRDLGITTVFVTHDQEEALSISDRVVVMNAGQIEQLGTPSEVYNRPATRFVATFVGKLNRLPAVVSNAEAGEMTLAGVPVVLAGKLAKHRTGDRVDVFMRPEGLSLQPTPERVGQLVGRVAGTQFLGSVVRLNVDVADAAIQIDTFNDHHAPVPRPGAQVTLHFNPKDLLLV